MSAAAWEVPEVLVHQNPWTEEEFLALPERPWPRVELLDGDAIILEAAEIALVAEVVSPSTVQVDRRLKPGYHPEGGIPWYLRVELQGIDASEVIAYRLKDDAYVEHARARAGETFRLSEPVDVTFDPAVLLRR